MNPTTAIAQIAGAAAVIALFKALPMDRSLVYAQAVRPVPLPPSAPQPNFRPPQNFGGGQLVSTLA